MTFGEYVGIICIIAAFIFGICLIVSAVAWLAKRTPERRKTCLFFLVATATTIVAPFLLFRPHNPSSGQSKSVQARVVQQKPKPAEKTPEQLATEAAAKAAEAEAAAKAAREKNIERQFSAWDGSHRKLEALIKSSMHNPSSFEHVRTVYSQYKDFLVVRTTFRGTNAFGAVVTNAVKARVNIDDGEVVEILDQR